MSPSFRRGTFAALFGFGVCLGVSAQTQTPPAAAGGANPMAAAPAASAQASAPAGKKKRESRAKTPPGKPAGGGHCEHGDKATRQRCLNDMYGPGGPRL
jgi:hypothetical protein